MVRFFSFIVVLIALASCSEYSKVLKEGSNDAKYDMAMKLYKKKDFNRALPLFEDLLAVYRGKEKSEEIYFYYSYCYYFLGQFELAAFHFNNFTENYYNSTKSEECSFAYCNCIFGGSLEPELDQTNTYKAIVEFQNFLNKYPESRFKDSCNNRIESLRVLLMEKSYNNAMLYYKMGDYTATIVALKNTLKDFPDFPKKSEVEFTILKSSYLLARHSVLEKKELRYSEFFENYSIFIKNNSESKYVKDAEAMNKSAQEELKKFKASIK